MSELAGSWERRVALVAAVVLAFAPGRSPASPSGATHATADRFGFEARIEEASACWMPDGEIVSAAVLARRVGGDAAYWTPGGSGCVWGYSRPDNPSTFRHPGGNLLLTYSADCAAPRDAGGCRISVPQCGLGYDGTTRVLQCPDAGAEFEADEVGFHGSSCQPDDAERRQFVVTSLEEVSGRAVPEPSNLGLGAGSREILGRPFEIGWTTSTQCSDDPTLPTAVSIDAGVRLPLRIHLLIQAVWGLREYVDGVVGTVCLRFADGQTETPLVLGYNLRDWSDQPVAVSWTASPDVVEAWSGRDVRGSPGHIDLLTICVPADLRSSTLASIELADTSVDATGSADPGINLLAATVEQALVVPPNGPSPTPSPPIPPTEITPPSPTPWPEKSAEIYLPSALLNANAAGVNVGVGVGVGVGAGSPS